MAITEYTAHIEIDPAIFQVDEDNSPDFYWDGSLTALTPGDTCDIERFAFDTVNDRLEDSEDWAPYIKVVKIDTRSVDFLTLWRPLDDDIDEDVVPVVSKVYFTEKTMHAYLILKLSNWPAIRLAMPTGERAR